MPINQILGRSVHEARAGCDLTGRCRLDGSGGSRADRTPASRRCEIRISTLPPGSQQAIIVGNPKNAEGYVIRVKLAKGTKVAPHTHPNDENVTVISGTFNIGVGEKLDKTKGQTVKAGGFFSVPKGKAHFAWASEDTVIQLHGVGPAGATFVNPADAPK
jgi:quercetin dioxygenase-like cupin family protein